MSSYKADNPASYEQSMGRWSRRLAPLLIQFANVKDGGRILDVGCGTGSLAFAFTETFPSSSITAIDYSQAYVDHARSKADNRKVHFGARLHAGGRYRNRRRWRQDRDGR